MAIKTPYLKYILLMDKKTNEIVALPPAVANSRLKEEARRVKDKTLHITECRWALAEEKEEPKPEVKAEITPEKKPATRKRRTRKPTPKKDS